MMNDGLFREDLFSRFFGKSTRLSACIEDYIIDQGKGLFINNEWVKLSEIQLQRIKQQLKDDSIQAFPEILDLYVDYDEDDNTLVETLPKYLGCVEINSRAITNATIFGLVQRRLIEDLLSYIPGYPYLSDWRIDLLSFIPIQYKCSTKNTVLSGNFF